MKDAEILEWIAENNPKIKTHFVPLNPCRKDCNYHSFLKHEHSGSRFVIDAYGVTPEKALRNVVEKAAIKIPQIVDLL